MPFEAREQARADTPPPHGGHGGFGMAREVGSAVADVAPGSTTTGAVDGALVCDDADAALYWSAIASPAQATDLAISVMWAHQQVSLALASSVQHLVQGHEFERLQVLLQQARVIGSRAQKRLSRVMRVCPHAVGMDGWNAWVVAEAFAVAGKLQVHVVRLSLIAIEAAVLATASEAPQEDTRVLRASPRVSPTAEAVERGRSRRKVRGGR